MKYFFELILMIIAFRYISEYFGVYYHHYYFIKKDDEKNSAADKNKKINDGEYVDYEEVK